MDQQQDQNSWQAFSRNILQPVLALGKLEDGMALLQNFLSQNPKDINGLMTMGNLALLSRHSRRYEQALQLYRRVQGIDPYYALAYQGEARVLSGMARYDQALEKVKTAIFLNNRDEESWKLFEQLRGHTPTLTAFENGQPDLVFYTGHPFFKKALPQIEELHQKPMAGGETMFLLMAKELSRLGKKVALFGNFGKIGLFSGIECRDNRDFFIFERYGGLPACIVSRHYQPFLNEFKKAKRRIFWLHDMALGPFKEAYQKMDAQVDEYWPLSDFHQKSFTDLGLPALKFWKTTNAFIPENFEEYVPLAGRTRYQLIYSSRPSRGLEMLLNVYPQLKKDFPRLTLKVCTYTHEKNVFDDPEISPLKDALDQPGVTLLSLKKEELAQELKKSHLMLYPNTGNAETSCIAVIEALAAGLPVVTSDRCCLGETVPDQKAGLVLPWTERADLLAGQLYEKAKKLLSDDGLWERLSRGALNTAHQRHHVGRLAQKWLERLGPYL